MSDKPISSFAKQSVQPMLDHLVEDSQKEGMENSRIYGVPLSELSKEELVGVIYFLEKQLGAIRKDVKL